MQSSRFRLILLMFTCTASIYPAQGIKGGGSRNPPKLTFSAVLKIGDAYPCSGSIISEKHILTAAICCVEEDNDQMPVRGLIQVIIGTANYKSFDTAGLKIDVKRYYVPLEFFRTPKGRYRTGDLAVLELKRDMHITGYTVVSKIGLPNEVFSHVDEPAALVGFGWDKIGYDPDPNSKFMGESSSQVRVADVTVMPLQYCQTNRRSKRLFPTKHLCGQVNQYDPHVSAGACIGDVGGPLIWDEYLPPEKRPWGEPQEETSSEFANTRGWVQWSKKSLSKMWPSRFHREDKREFAVIGVLSDIDSRCNERDNPSVYTNVSTYKGFITNAMRDVCDPSTCVKQNLP